MRGDLLVCEAAAAQFGDVECDVVRQESRSAEARASCPRGCKCGARSLRDQSPLELRKGDLHGHHHFADWRYEVDGAVDRDERPSLRLCVVEQAKEVASPRLRAGFCSLLGCRSDAVTLDLLLALSLCPAECPVGRAKDVHLPGNHRERPLG